MILKTCPWNKDLRYSSLQSVEVLATVYLIYSWNMFLPRTALDQSNEAFGLLLLSVAIAVSSTKPLEGVGSKFNTHRSTRADIFLDIVENQKPPRGIKNTRYDQVQGMSGVLTYANCKYLINSWWSQFLKQQVGFWGIHFFTFRVLVLAVPPHGLYNQNTSPTCWNPLY